MSVEPSYVLREPTAIKIFKEPSHSEQPFLTHWELLRKYWTVGFAF